MGAYSATPVYHGHDKSIAIVDMIADQVDAAGRHGANVGPGVELVDEQADSIDLQGRERHRAASLSFDRIARLPIDARAIAVLSAPCPLVSVRSARSLVT